MIVSSNDSLLSNVNLLVIHPHSVVRAGSSFLQSLFDGHGSFVTLPYLKRIHSTLPTLINDVEAFLHGFVDCHPALFDTSKGYYGSYGGGFGPDFTTPIRIDQHKFIQYFLLLLNETLPNASSTKTSIDRRLFFIILHFSYLKVWNPLVNLKAIRFIVYNPHEGLDLDALLSDFPELKYICMLRDPRQNWLSNAKLIENRAKISRSNLSPVWMIKSLNSYSESIVTLAVARRHIRTGDFKVLDLEQLHVQNRSVIHKICCWLEVEFDECLMTSTFTSRRWAGNSATLQASSGFNPKMKVDDWKVSLTKDEIGYISNYQSNCLTFLGYEVPAENAEVRQISSDANRIAFLIYIFQESQAILVAAIRFSGGESSFIKVLKAMKRVIFGFPFILSLFAIWFKQDMVAMKLLPNPDLDLINELTLKKEEKLSH
jgi:hypothetical protein